MGLEKLEEWDGVVNLKKINVFNDGKCFYIVDRADFTENLLEILHLNSNLTY